MIAINQSSIVIDDNLEVTTLSSMEKLKKKSAPLQMHT
jgi:hypothetical protein